ncbi:galacturonosyltransferase 7 [Striga asiatica]|uniref:Galacturonosyltransferase 7 n=1 Tax=Striga asiatica TaxID=4170 RepID=A0A5A7P7H8_STRAF|nr:galacturonosyltransferase 7 [Striga asiatica]
MGFSHEIDFHEDLTPEMCGDSSPFLGIKRAASSSEALAAVEMKKSKGSVDTANPVAKVSSDPSFSVIHFLVLSDGVEIMSGIVKNISGLKSQVENIFSQLKLAVGDDRFVHHLSQLIANLLKDEDFHKAFVMAYIKDPCPEVLALLEAYSMEKSDQERVEDLRRDVTLGRVLQRKTDTTYYVREMVSIILGYWSSPWFCSKLREAVNGNDAARDVPRMTRIINVDVPPSIEGLKEALATGFCGEELRRMCERIDRDNYGMRILRFSPTHRMKWFDIVWLEGEEFSWGAQGFYEHPYPGCTPP